MKKTIKYYLVILTLLLFCQVSNAQWSKIYTYNFSDLGWPRYFNFCTPDTGYFEFDSIGVIKSSDVNSNHINYYNFLDKMPTNGTTYYRLKQVDYDGVTELFPTKSVYFEDVEGFKIYYDSEKYRMDLYGVEGRQKVKFTIMNIKGEKIYEYEVICKCNPECCVIDLKDKLPFGLYSLTWDTRGKLFTHKFIAH